MRKFLATLLALVMTLALMVPASWGENKETYQLPDSLEGKTVILHTNDVHGAIDKYAKVAALRDECYDKGAHQVILLDAGDYSQGSPYVSLSKGATALDMMALVGYDVITLGNHEFDYGFPQLMENLKKHQGDFMVACNNLVDEAGDITTNSPKVRKARKTILELILANHPQDCLHCEKNGKCELQKLAAEYNIRGNIFDPVWKPVPKEMSNPALVRDMTKCVRCGRCVEACQADKILLGIPAYGRMWRQVSGRAVTQTAGISGTKVLNFPDLLALESQGYTRYYDGAAKAAYWVGGENFVSGEDEQSIRDKAQWAVQQGLQGAAVWSYGQDASGKLLAWLKEALSQ